ncbi:hypothetical protein [Reichenbachiella sp. MALMAid0571]|uniref:hypothetical protein n=1 Tax=Reichenbachiella sp. MALMAid0571 TaxID=3143939 RepID=UPI0032E040C7
MYRFEMPRQVKSDYHGYQTFIDLANQTKEFVFEDIVIDFEQNTWFEANLCAVLGTIISNISDLNSVELINMNSWLENILSKNGFLVNFGGQLKIDFHQTTVKYQKYKVTEEKLIKKYLDEELLQKNEFPKLSGLLRKKIGESIFEIFSNAAIHGKCTHVYSCGQHYPNKTPARLDFTIVDLGRTIKKNVADYLNSPIDGVDAIKWAVTEGHTTKQGSHPGGLGLKVIMEFLKINNGKMQIVSSDGYWELVRNEISFMSYVNSFPGTLINLEFNLDDKEAYYDIQEGLSIDDIF